MKELATPFTDIYERAIFKFSDRSLLELTDEEREQVLEKYLFSAQARFANVCRIDLSDRDDEKKQYNNTLDEASIEILSLGIAYYWLRAKVLRVELMKNNMSTKDFTVFSNANLLKEVRTTRDQIYKEWLGAMNDYSYRNGDIANLKA